MARKIIVVGMHRSGTSAVAGWLDKCGINMGHSQLGLNQNNSKGHFEDLDILEFHKNLAKNRNIHNWKIYNDFQSNWSNDESAFIRELIFEKDSSNAQWGFKEPRTCLYLNEWIKVLPDATYLFVYRHYSEVSKSLVNREIRNYLNRYNLKLKNKYVNMLASLLFIRINSYLRMWKFYNYQIITFFPKVKKNAFCLEFKDFEFRKNELIYFLRKSGFNLESIEDETGFVNMNLLTSSMNLKDHEADHIYNQLLSFK